MKTILSPFPCSPPGSPSPYCFYPSLRQRTLDWLLSVVLVWRPSKATTFCIQFFFCRPYRRPKRRDSSPPHVSLRSRAFSDNPQPQMSFIGWLLFELKKRRLPMVSAPFPSLFSDSAQFVAQSSPHRASLRELRAPGVAHNMVSTHVMLDRANDSDGRQQRRRRTPPVLRKKSL